MSALTDLFSAMATKIRSKTGTQTTYTPPEMVSDGIDDVYAAGVAAGGTSTPITPSNSSPASMTSGTKYTPSTNGYAIASYDSVTPSSTPESVASGDIVKIGGSGVIVDAIPTPTSITPSNSSPVALTADTPVNPTASGYAVATITELIASNANPVPLYRYNQIYRNMTGSGSGGTAYAIESYSDVTPSNSSPVSLSSGSIYKTDGSGYAISSYSSKTPSDTSPASVSSGAIIKASSSGYLYATVQPKVVTGSYTLTTSAKTITCGFKPKYIMFTEYKNSNVFAAQVYDERRSTTNAIRGVKSTSSSDGASDLAVGSGNVRLTSITSTGFTIGAGDSTHTGTIYYVAVG